MVDVNTLKDITNPWQLAESAITHGPVRQQARQSGEYGKRIASHRSVCSKEGRYHYVRAVLAHSTVGRVELLSGKGRTCGVSCTSIPCLDTIAETVERTAELLERRRMVSVGCIAHALEGTAYADSGHRQRTALGGRRAGIHVLYAFCLILGSAGIKVYLKILHRFKSHAQLEIFRKVRSRRSCHAVVHQQPSTV